MLRNSIDATGDGIGEDMPFDAYHQDYVENVMDFWRKCCAKTVKRMFSFEHALITCYLFYLVI